MACSAQRLVTQYQVNTTTITISVTRAKERFSSLGTSSPAQEERQTLLTYVVYTALPHSSSAQVSPDM